MFSDIDLSQIIFGKTPPAWHPYIKLARLDRPIGIWLLLLPCLWSLVLGSGGLSFVSPYKVILFIVGAFLMRAAGCVINDIWDKELDANVTRTQTRPLASGEISVTYAFRFLLALLAASLLILIQLPHMAVVLGVFSLLLVVAYPYMKRITWIPQLFLGLTFNWGALMGWAAATDSLSMPALLLYIGGIFWTLAYDTIYAHQDIEDDVRVGIKSTARLFGKNSKLFVRIFYVLSIIFIFIARKESREISLLTPLTTAIPLIYGLWRVQLWNKDDPASCLRTFKESQGYGWLVLLMLMI